MKLMLATLCLNEMEWLPRLYQQHINWADVDLKWVFVESADQIYANTNPQLVSNRGLSVDGTTDWLVDTCLDDKRVKYIPHGFSSNHDKAQGKCEARNRYLEYADEWKPDYIIVIDADEFWCFDQQMNVLDWMQADRSKLAFSAHHTEIWHPPILKDEPLFKYEVKGGFWDILYCRMWKWISGMRYNGNHNTPSLSNGIPFDRRMKNHTTYAQLSKNKIKVPSYVHMGFASQKDKRIAKNEYYKARGESVDPRRSWYTESRDCFLTWKPGDSLPRGAQVIEYTGPVPEVFQDEQYRVCV